MTSPMPHAPAPLPRRRARHALAAALAAAALLIGPGALPVAAAPHAAAEDEPAEATEEVTWAVEPADRDGRDDRVAFAYAVDAGTQIRDFVVITNFSGATSEFTVYATDAITDFDTGAFGLKPVDVAPDDLGAWITTDVSKVTLAPGQAAVVPFEVLVPSDATPGDHAAGIIASITIAGTDESGQAINLEQRVASRVYLRVSGTTVAAVEATGLVAGYAPEWNPFGGGTANVDYAVTNTGNLRVDVAQEVIVRGPFGIELAVLEADPVRNLLPGHARHMRVETGGIPPILLLFGVVTLTPGEPTDTIAQSGGERAATGRDAPPRTEPEYFPVTAETMTGAISWTLLLLVLLVGVLIWLGWRYVTVTRERMFDAIDEAEEAARREALNELDAREREPAR